MSNHGDTNNCSADGDHTCLHHTTNSSLQQTLDELDFERGIWASALAGDNEELENKLKEGKYLDVNCRDKYGYTALHYACRNGHLRVCHSLLSYHADVNLATLGSGATPLHRAAYMGHSQIVKLLLAHGADVKIADCDGMLPMHKSAQNGHVETFRILYDCSPGTLQMKDSRGRTYLDIAKPGIRSELELLIDSEKT